MKTRSDSILASLTQDQRDQLYDWLCAKSYSEVQALAAKPEADGFDLKFHRTTLARFFETEQKERQARELAELAAAADNDTTPVQLDSLIRITRERFTRAAYELAKSAASERADFDRLQRALHSMDLIQARREDLELKRKDVALEEARLTEQRRQWEFDAAREVMRNFVAYEKIHRRRDINEHSKIWKAREVAFGKSPNASPLLGEREKGEGQSPAPSPTTQSDTQLHTGFVPPLPPEAEPEKTQPSSLDPHPSADPCPVDSSPIPDDPELRKLWYETLTHYYTLLHANGSSPSGEDQIQPSSLNPHPSLDPGPGTHNPTPPPNS